MPKDIYDRYANIKCKMEKDITKVTGKETKLSMPKVFRAIAFHEYNENSIEVSFKKLVNLSKQRKG